MKKGLFSLSPLLLFLGLYVGTSLVAGDFLRVPITVPFLLASIYAVAIASGPLNRRIETFSRGAGSRDMMMMMWIFVLAGAFAMSAQVMGAVDATVNLMLRLLPSSFLLPGIFLAACFISMAVGTSCGTVAALIPVAVGIAMQTDVSVPMVCAIVVGGAFFGDNLSFISDTTIIATQTQGCRMSDKFRINFRIVLPVAVLMLAIYYVIGLDIRVPQELPHVELWKVLPYATVLVAAMCGVNVMTVLTVGLAMTGIIGILDGSYDLFGWFGSMSSGMLGMGELIIMTLLAAGMLAMIRASGGIDYLISLLTRRIAGRRTAEFAIAAMIFLINLCTANNTVAIITAGPIARDISDRFRLDPRVVASILDTTCCFAQGLLPYGAQLLIASGLASTAMGQPIDPTAIVGYLYYPMGIGLAVVVSIALQRPRPANRAGQ